MRKLILMRHAQAEARAPSGDDFDRALTEAGQSDAALMGRVLAEAGLQPDLALVSAAQRTRETWEAAAQAFGEVEARFDRRLYNAGSAEIRNAIERAGDAEAIMVVGHNPGLPLAMLELIIEAAEPASVMDRARSKFPPASAVVFDFDEHLRPRFSSLFFAADHGGGSGE